MAKKPVGKAKLAPKTHGKIAIIAKELNKQIMIDGLSQYTLDGIIEAKWKIAGIATLLLRLGNKIAAMECANDAGRLDALLNSDTTRAEVWQNLKDAGIEPKQAVIPDSKK